MKIIKGKKGMSGIAMTEYLIILAVVAVAAILVVGLFGRQIKNVFAENTSALAGSTNTAGRSSTAKSAVGNATQDNMASFNKGASSTGK